MSWYKGTLHCHTNRSDGRALPLHVGQFYRIQGHDFLGVADHNRLTPPEVYAPQSGLVGVPCSEYTGEACCHVVGVGVKAAIGPAPSKRRKPRAKRVILQDGIDQALAAAGIPVVCHPNWHWAVDVDDMLALRACRHFEICNAGPDCNAFPIPGYEPGDKLWDTLLTAGHRYYGLANDDAHDYFVPPLPRSPMGGLGFNVVKVAKLTAESVAAAIGQGHFYASTGVMLSLYRVTGEGIAIAVQQQSAEHTVFQFFGEGGKELLHVFGGSACYKFSGSEKYVRVRVASTAGLWAWTQPVFLDDLGDAIRWTADKPAARKRAGA